MVVFVNMSACIKLVYICFICTTRNVYGNEIESYDIDVKFSNDNKYLEHFWESTGLCPPEPYANVSTYLLSPDMNLNLALIGSLPRSDLFQVRIHWLLDLITVKQFQENKPIYNFQHLDSLISALKKNRLKPGFELMGNPSGIFTDFENQTQLYQWRDLVQTVAKRYIAKYGINYVQQWNFESWNEPDHRDFDNVNFTLRAFLNYYDACSEGLRLADQRLRLGGPAESFRGKFTYFSLGLLSHCYNGTNYFTGEKGVRLDFISMHKKGDNTAISILDEELGTIQYIFSAFPKFKTLPIYNDEADPLVGWWKSEIWRADNTYAAIIVKVIGQHLNLLLLNANNSINYRVLSNDNGFLNSFPNLFDQRTLVTRFNNSAAESKASYMIRKPVFIATGLLNYLGEKYTKARITQTKGSTAFSNNSYIGGIAAYHEPDSQNPQDSFNFGVIIYNSADTTYSNVLLNLTINIDLLNLTSLKLNQKRKIDRNVMWVCYKLDNNLTNPYKTWLQIGQPVQPDAHQLQQMRQQEGPFRLAPPQPHKSFKGKFTLSHTLSQPGILVVHACVKPRVAPGKVTNIEIHPVSSCDCLVTWSAHKLFTKCIKTFDVQFSPNITGPYRQLNNGDIVFHSLALGPDTTGLDGYYRIRAVDYWERFGKWTTKFDRCTPEIS